MGQYGSDLKAVITEVWAVGRGVKINGAKNKILMVLLQLPRAVFPVHLAYHKFIRWHNMGQQLLTYAIGG